MQSSLKPIPRGSSAEAANTSGKGTIMLKIANSFAIMRRFRQGADLGPPALSALILVFLISMVLAGCGNRTTSAFSRPPAPVTVAMAEVQDVPVYLDEIGKCVAREVVSIQPQVSGSITGIHFKDGADLKSGDLLFTIDPRPFEAELQRVQANLAKDEALLKLAQANVARDLVQAKNGEVQSRRYEGLLKLEGVSKE